MDTNEKKTQTVAPTLLYRCMTAHGQPVYIGVTSNLNTRINAHRKAYWYIEVAYVETEKFASRAEALVAEKLAIETEAPRFNAVHSASKPERSKVWNTDARIAARSLPDPEWLTLEEASARIRCDKVTVRRLISRGEIPGYRVGKRFLRVRVADVDALFRQIPTR